MKLNLSTGTYHTCIFNVNFYQGILFSDVSVIESREKTFLEDVREYILILHKFPCSFRLCVKRSIMGTLYHSLDFSQKFWKFSKIRFQMAIYNTCIIIMYESLKDLDRTEFRLKTPHLGPARPHAPTPVDTPISTPAPIQSAKQPVKDKQANR